MTHAPLTVEALNGEPMMRCGQCDAVTFHAPDLAMQWADPYCAHLSIVCSTCRADNHLRLSYHLGRVYITQRSTPCQPTTTI